MFLHSAVVNDCNYEHKDNAYIDTLLTDWAVLAFRSLQPKTNDFPMGAVQSVSDGPVGNSKGKPYMYVSELEDAVRDTEVSI
jgi:hypothetical protein